MKLEGSLAAGERGRRLGVIHGRRGLAVWLFLGAPLGAILFLALVNSSYILQLFGTWWALLPAAVVCALEALNLILLASGFSAIDRLAKRRAWRSRVKARAEIALLAFSFVFLVFPSVVSVLYAPWISQLLAISNIQIAIGGH